MGTTRDRDGAIIFLRRSRATSSSYYVVERQKGRTSPLAVFLREARERFPLVTEAMGRELAAEDELRAREESQAEEGDRAGE